MLTENGKGTAGDIEHYINTIKAAISFFAPSLDTAEIYGLDIHSEALKTKRHPFYSLWDHFMSYLVFHNRGIEEGFAYIEIGYD